VPRSYRFASTTALIGLLAVAAAVRPASAQITATASINAVANVTGVAPLTAAGVNNLNFGNVTAGTPKSPSNLAADAGRFNISGQPSANVTVSFALPTQLDGAGGSFIPVTFGSTDGLNWSSFPSTFTTFNPNANFFTVLSGTGGLVIGLTGTVSPAALTSTGTYTGTVTMTVTY
jgi:spore coat protein U-like protein